MKNKTYIWTKLGAVMLVVLVTSCFPDDFGSGNGLSDDDVNAEFTITPVAGKSNRYVLKAEADGVLGVKWDLGEGGGSALGSIIDTVFYPDAGTYTVTLTAIGRGGKTATVTHDVVVNSSDPNAGNLVVGGKMNPGDDASWTVLPYSAGVNVEMTGGKMVWTGGGWGQKGIYQTVQVVGGKKYKVDMLVSGSGSSNTWFEVYVGKSAPGAVDYGEGGKRLALSTWAGCATSAFSGKFSVLTCDANAPNAPVVTFPESGTAYLVIRGGGENLGTISVDNVEFRGTN